MSSFEWMELHALTSEINASRTRLSAARVNKDSRLARVLEEEIAGAEQRRTRLLAHITTHLASVPEGSPPAEAIEEANPGQALAQIEEIADQAAAEQPLAEIGDRSIGSAAPSPAAAIPQADNSGGIIVWDQLSFGDIERETNQLGVRRAEMLARHAEELKALEVDQTQLDALEQAIEAFVRRFGPSSPEDAQQSAPGSAIVVLGEERESRLQGRA